MIKKIIIIFLFCFLSFPLVKNVYADQILENQTSDVIFTDNKKVLKTFLDKETISKGYTVNAFNDYLKLSLVPGILSEDTDVLVEEILDSEMDLPWNMKKESSILQFEFKNKQAYNNHNPFYIQFSYDQESPNLKKVFFYDKTCNLWRPLPTWDFPKEKFVRSLIYLPYARIAVFSFPEVLSIGTASWYKYKNGNFAASPDFPKGSVLRVHNLNNKKFVDVVVNDYGPDKTIFPNRILDLDHEAFKKISDKGDGLVNVFIEPLSIASSRSNKLDVKKGIGVAPEIKSKSIVLIDENENKIILEKNSDKSMPIASLTKIIAIFTFLNEKNNKDRLNEIVQYSSKDEEYNYKYFPKWQIAKIDLKDGDSLSVRDLIYSALVRSANNAVETLVRISGISRDDFIKKMNNWAKENGSQTININEPTGLDKNNVLSAKEFSFLASKIFDEPLIRDASIAKSYKFSTRNDNSTKLRYNSSDLVLNNNYKNFKIIGSKTGYLDDAGYCLITRAEIKGKKFLVVSLNSSSRSESFSETIDLLNYAYYLSNK